MSETMKASTKLKIALQEVNAPQQMIANAEAGYYGDFTSPLATPIGQLVTDCREIGLDKIAKRAMNGEFDGR